ncbi:tRNA (uridine(54)-C5)-methyltransferase TrmA [Lacimicrobium alkaliphilum]|uniref:tRNA/tmRNA (uracil-C(5))-methyltransferase n=1 Tax=Lacimicrobium alkaliphilum TaxID=1526571 RepID=A0ABQ1RNR1_9ALTE|nr:tRNA (uridine(54)-C5)-methyltransferase TrmA [Lacimicrobium alkaliphilum]GGD73033.1 tRNA/tmRNA (uracil-C(5))-methyltransferase [Lacimicrobium alkaliphilum]
MRPTEIDSSNYQNMLNEKTTQIEKRFTEFACPELEVFPSAPLHYRMRAEFRVWHQSDDLFHIMFDAQTKEKYRVDRFPPASNLINDVMQDIIPLIKSNQFARRKLYQIDYLSTLSGEILVTLIYHRPLDEQWQQSITSILQELRKKYHIDIVGRARKQQWQLDRNFVVETLQINNRALHFKQIENSFTQPNAGVNQKMIEWALDVTQGFEGDLLELYCGLGNFTLPLAQNFNQVLATEISKASVDAANSNMVLNKVENVTVIRMSSEEFTQAKKGQRTFRRLQDVDLQSFNCNTVLVDPPRAGLDTETCELVSEYNNIVYISCNPETLLNNLQYLTQTHSIERFALFDQFPYTHHVECGVLLRRNK